MSSTGQSRTKTTVMQAPKAWEIRARSTAPAELDCDVDAGVALKAVERLLSSITVAADFLVSVLVLAVLAAGCAPVLCLSLVSLAAALSALSLRSLSFCFFFFAF